jgi:hypothetical protein
VWIDTETRTPVNGLRWAYRPHDSLRPVYQRCVQGITHLEPIRGVVAAGADWPLALQMPISGNPVAPRADSAESGATIRLSVAHNESTAPTTFLIMIAPTAFMRAGGTLPARMGKIAWPCLVPSKWYRYCS